MTFNISKINSRLCSKPFAIETIDDRKMVV